MGFTQNQTDPHDVAVYLEDPAGNAYTGSLTGFTIVYRKPGSGTDTGTSLIADGGDGRYRMTVPVDVAGTGWVKVVDPANKIIPFVDGFRVAAETPDVQTINSNVSTSLANEAAISAAITALAAQVTDVQGRLPNALVSGNLKAVVQAYASGQAPLQPSTAGRTLQVTAAGRTGIDWANVENPSTAINLSGTTVGTVSALASTAYNAVRDALLNFVIDSTGATPRTVIGTLRRMNAWLMGKAVNLLASNPKFYMQDGTTEAINAVQDTSAGTRDAGATSGSID